MKNMTVTELVSRKPPESIQVYASSISRNVPVEKLIKELKCLKSLHGIDSFKVKIGKRMGKQEKVDEESINQLQYIMKELPNSKLSIDCNGAYRTVNSIKPLLNLNLWFIEEPFRWFDYAEYGRLKEFSTKHNKEFKLAGGEQEFRRDIWDIHTNLFHILQPDVGYCGGFSTILELSKKHELIVPHSPVFLI